MPLALHLGIRPDSRQSERILANRTGRHVKPLDLFAVHINNRTVVATDLTEVSFELTRSDERTSKKSDPAFVTRIISKRELRPNVAITIPQKRRPIGPARIIEGCDSPVDVCTHTPILILPTLGSCRDQRFSRVRTDICQREHEADYTKLQLHRANSSSTKGIANPFPSSDNSSPETIVGDILVGDAGGAFHRVERLQHAP